LAGIERRMTLAVSTGVLSISFRVSVRADA
jgi:hypothetical protein